MVPVFLVVLTLLAPVLGMAWFLKSQTKKSKRKQKALEALGAQFLEESKLEFHAFETHRIGRFQNEPLRNLYAMDQASLWLKGDVLYLFGKTRFFVFDWHLPPLSLKPWKLVKLETKTPNKNCWFAQCLKVDSNELVLQLQKNKGDAQVVLRIWNPPESLRKLMENAPFLAYQETNQSQGGISPEAAP